MTNFVTPYIPKNEQQIYYLKTMESANTQISRPPPHPLPCGYHKCMVPYRFVH